MDIPPRLLAQTGATSVSPTASTIPHGLLDAGSRGHGPVVHSMLSSDHYRTAASEPGPGSAFRSLFRLHPPLLKPSIERGQSFVVVAFLFSVEGSDLLGGQGWDEFWTAIQEGIHIPICAFPVTDGTCTSTVCVASMHKVNVLKTEVAECKLHSTLCWLLIRILPRIVDAATTNVVDESFGQLTIPYTLCICQMCTEVPVGSLAGVSGPNRKRSEPADAVYVRRHPHWVPAKAAVDTVGTLSALWVEARSPPVAHQLDTLLRLA
nr:hypothetical protein CFP56_04588 [Quercus suber]